jgi:exosome complex RNA-binding protein Csl4
MKSISKTILVFSFLIFLSISSVVLAAAVTTKPNHKFSLPKPKTFSQNNTKSANLVNADNVSGTINTISGNSITVSIRKIKNDTTAQTKTITVDVKTEITKDLNKIQLSDLKVGDTVRAILELLPDNTFRTRSVRVITAKTDGILKQIRSEEPKI